MKRIFTNFSINFLSLAFLLAASFSVNAQIGCPNQTVLGTEDFGQGTTPASDPNVINFNYQATGPLTSDGNYRIADSTNQKPEWQISGDHTGNLHGRMLVANGVAGTFYDRSITLPQGFVPGDYSVSLYIMNVDTLGVCGAGALLPVLSITVEYLSQSNTWIPLLGSPYTSSAIPQTAKPTWVNIGSTFTIPAAGSFIPKTIRARISSLTASGCGNDFAIDDMTLAFCPSGGPMPVSFMDFSARQSGSGISLDWSTAQEINNSYFEVQRSADGNSNWQDITQVAGAGNSQTVRKYHAFDNSPLSGINYYRIKQVDYDGKYMFSKVVSVKTDFNKTGVSVLVNPFFNNLSVSFSSASSQMVSARLIDVAGRQIALEKWSVPSGNSMRSFSNVSGLQQGLYILSVANSNGEILYTGKVIRQ